MKQYGKYLAQKRHSLNVYAQLRERAKMLYEKLHILNSLINSCHNVFVFLDTAFLYFCNIRLVQSCEEHAREVLDKRRHSLSKHE